ncbi:hypothetical protein C5167_016258 [Papaver somniferum]|nr:hypothetical protein C5167_016258 [Papaver somniferum]
MFIVKHWHNSSVISFGYHFMVQAMSESIGEDSGNTNGASQNIMPSLNILNNLACSPTNTSQDRKHPACDLSYFGRREFSFILGNDVYLHYQSFNNAAQMESSIKRDCPFKIDISAPAKRNAYSGENAFTPVEKELVFDIDMSDYVDVWYRCSGANICKNGPRGVHCWVFDARARRLNNAQRAAIADCFHVYKVGSQSGCEKVFLEGPVVHPSLV